MPPTSRYDRKFHTTSLSASVCQKHSWQLGGGEKDISTLDSRTPLAILCDQLEYMSLVLPRHTELSFEFQRLGWCRYTKLKYAHRLAQALAIYLRQQATASELWHSQPGLALDCETVLQAPFPSSHHHHRRLWQVLDRMQVRSLKQQQDRYYAQRLVRALLLILHAEWQKQMPDWPPTATTTAGTSAPAPYTPVSVARFAPLTIQSVVESKLFQASDDRTLSEMFQRLPSAVRTELSETCGVAAVAKDMLPEPEWEKLSELWHATLKTGLWTDFTLCVAFLARGDLLRRWVTYGPDLERIRQTCQRKLNVAFDRRRFISPTSERLGLVPALEMWVRQLEWPLVLQQQQQALQLGYTLSRLLLGHVCEIETDMQDIFLY